MKNKKYSGNWLATKTSIGAKQHIEYLHKLFADYKEITMAMMTEIVKAYSKKKYLRQSLKRMMESGLVVKSGSRYISTQEGNLIFRKYRGQRLEVDQWDGKWRLVSFDVPGDYSTERNRIRNLLKEFNFYPLHKSVWISPNYLTDEFWNILVKEDLDKYCKIMLVQIVEGDKSLRDYFNL